MTAEERCDCCDLPKNACGRSTEIRTRAAEREERSDLIARGYFEASYRGVCASCGEPFEKGDPIRSVRVRADSNRCYSSGLCCGDLDDAPRPAAVQKSGWGQ